MSSFHNTNLSLQLYNMSSSYKLVYEFENKATVTIYILKGLKEQYNQFVSYSRKKIVPLYFSYYFLIHNDFYNSWIRLEISSIQEFSSVAQLCLTLCDLMDCSTPGFPVNHQLLELAQTHVYWVSDAIQPSHPLSSPFLSTFNMTQQQGLFQWVSSSHQVAKVLELQLQHQSFQWIFRTDFL